LLIDGVARAVLPRDAHGPVALFVLIFAIGISNWVQYARTVRGSTLVEKNKEYIQAARVIGIRPFAIMLHHLLPNVLGPVLVFATIDMPPRSAPKPRSLSLASACRRRSPRSVR
jgi:peptide/nickel transport system permease protein